MALKSVEVQLFGRDLGGGRGILSLPVLLFPVISGSGGLDLPGLFSGVTSLTYTALRRLEAVEAIKRDWFEASSCYGHSGQLAIYFDTFYNYWFFFNFLKKNIEKRYKNIHFLKDVFGWYFCNHRKTSKVDEAPHTVQLYGVPHGILKESLKTPFYTKMSFKIVKFYNRPSVFSLSNLL
jgi:hypothetical protein